MMPLEQILEYFHCCAVYWDIIVTAECGSFRKRQMPSLLKAENQLAELFSKLENLEINRKDCIIAIIDCKSNEVSREEYIKDIHK